MDLVIPAMTGQVHYTDGNWQQPPSLSWRAPLPYCNVTGLLEYQRSGIDEALVTIYEAINQQKLDLHTRIPELRSKLYSRIADHIENIKYLATHLGDHGHWSGL